MIKREVQAVVVIFIVLAMGLIYVGHQTSNLQGQVNELQETTNAIVETTNTIVESLRTHVSELEDYVSKLEDLIVECVVEIDNGTEVKTEEVCLTKGATALDALRRVAVVETTYSAGLGEFINSIDGVSNDWGANKFWMWYVWEDGTWKGPPVGAGGYKLKDGDKIKFSYEIPSW